MASRQRGTPSICEYGITIRRWTRRSRSRSRHAALLRQRDLPALASRGENGEAYPECRLSPSPGMERGTEAGDGVAQLIQHFRARDCRRRHGFVPLHVVGVNDDAIRYRPQVRVFARHDDQTEVIMSQWCDGRLLDRTIAATGLERRLV